MTFDFYITGTIGVAYDWWTGQRGTTADQVKFFLKEHKDQELTIAVSSLGGYIDDGLAIMEYIKDHGKCNMVIIGMTASAATVLCMKAKSVKIARGSMMLIHNSSQMLDIWTSANKERIDEIIQMFQHEREQLDTIDKCLADIYSVKNGKTIDENLEMMGKEKWLSAKDALEFGLVDSVLDDDDDLTAKSKSIKNAFAGYVGAAEHYGLPAFSGDKEPSRSFMQRMKEGLSRISAIMNEAEPDSGVNSPNNNQTKAMKKIILNLFCAVLALKEIELDQEAGTAKLTEDQLNTIENDLKAKADEITSLKAQLQTAQDEKAAVEQELSDLQTEFETFKGSAGDHTTSHPASSGAPKEPTTARELLDSVKNFL
ncbi:MAG: ATP-dependent Clp protease proteolytic subunit [Prevotella sp.]|nr:ATP-dependent Clp protease proteolytic subunit [Prevotella sp.]